MAGATVLRDHLGVERRVVRVAPAAGLFAIYVARGTWATRDERMVHVHVVDRAT